MRWPPQLRYILLAWALLLFAASLVLPNLSIQTRQQHNVRLVTLTFWLLLTAGTFIAVPRYLLAVWRKARFVENRKVYTCWITLESFGAVLMLASLAYTTVTFSTSVLR